MESQQLNWKNHLWKTRSVCLGCFRLMEHLPIFYCSQKHAFCKYCFQKINVIPPTPNKNNNNDESNIKDCPFCKLRKNSVIGIGRSSFRANRNNNPSIKNNSIKNYQNLQSSTHHHHHHHHHYDDAANINAHQPSSSNFNEINEEKLFENLLGISKEKLFHESQFIDDYSQKFLPHHRRKMIKPRSKLCLPSSLSDSSAVIVHLQQIPSTSSKRPFRCPHTPCDKTVAISQFINHFKSEHNDVQFCAIERQKELLFRFDVNLIEYDFHYCLAMITVYEINRIDYLKSTSTESVVRTCSKFCQKVPVSTFWLMVSGSPRPNNELSSSSSKKSLNCLSYCIIWMFTNSEDTHKCTIELGSMDDSVALSTYCGVIKVLEKNFGNIIRNNKLRGLLITRSTLKNLIRNGILLNLRVTVH